MARFDSEAGLTALEINDAFRFFFLLLLNKNVLPLHKR